MLNDDQFYVILRSDDEKAVRHTSYSDAVNEAKRLCAKEGKPMLILQTISKAEMVQNPVALIAIEWPTEIEPAREHG